MSYLSESKPNRLPAGGCPTYYDIEKYVYPGYIVNEGYIGKTPVGPIPSEKSTKYKRGKKRKSDKTVWVKNPNWDDDGELMKEEMNT